MISNNLTNAPKQSWPASPHFVPPPGTGFPSHGIIATRMSPQVRNSAQKGTLLLCVAMNTRFPLGCQKVENVYPYFKNSNGIS